MKKWLLIILLCLPLLLGQTVQYTNQITIEWDAVTDTGAISYEVYFAPYPVADPQNVDTLTFVEETALLESTVTFATEGKYAVGVRTKKVIDGETLFSEVNWSYENGVNTPNPFIVGFFTPPVAPENLRSQ
jgi:hypothetical protein